MTPVESAWGVSLMSIGFFAQMNQAVVWRGAMVDKALKQMVNETHWGNLDYLFIDLPPGTGGCSSHSGAVRPFNRCSGGFYASTRGFS
mgnify:CR=1 FL=1